MINLVKKQYADHELLRGLCRQLGTLRRQTLLGRYGVLAPPTLRDKDRFLRIFDILDWVTRVDDAWQDLDVEARRRLAFLKTYQPLLAELSQVRELVSLTGQLFKTKGLSRASIQHWQRAVAAWTARQATMPGIVNQPIEGVQRYVDDHVKLLDKHTILLCCSDVIESIFGRYKNKSGVKAISADVLKITLYNVDIMLDFIDRALTTVSYQDVYDWATKHTCPTRYGQLRSLRKGPESAKAAA